LEIGEMVSLKATMGWDGMFSAGGDVYLECPIQMTPAPPVPELIEPIVPEEAPPVADVIVGPDPIVEIDEPATVIAEPSPAPEQLAFTGPSLIESLLLLAGALILAGIAAIVASRNSDDSLMRVKE